MILLLGIGFLAGLITGISPCILPMIPIIIAGNANASTKRQPVVMIAGLVLSFTFVILISGTLLSVFHLPQNLLTKLAIVALFAIAVGLMIPQIGDVVDRPFRRLTRKGTPTSENAFLFGLGLGPLFVPCAGPVLAALTLIGATERISFGALILALSFTVGATLPLLILGIASQRIATGAAWCKRHALALRRTSGALLFIMALALSFNWATGLQTSIPGYSQSLQTAVEKNTAANQQLHQLTGQGGTLTSGNPAPNFTQIAAWINTPGDKPLTMKALRGKTVLVDFWTYSCINCIRSLPHVEAWYRAYKNDGLVVVGISTPEFPFEHVLSNVQTAVKQDGLTYPVALDNNYGTWNAYSNDVWPADYLIDGDGNIQYESFGETGYAQLETQIRSVLMADGAKNLPPPTNVPNRAPTYQITPETYLGSDYPSLSERYVGTTLQEGIATQYTPPSSIPQNDVSFKGTWVFEPEEMTAVKNADIFLNYQADDVYLVMGGNGTVIVDRNGTYVRTDQISGIPRLYTLYSGSSEKAGTLHIKVSSGVEAYDFTFG